MAILKRPHNLSEENLTNEYPYAIAKFMLDLGVFARLFIGAVGGLIGIWFLNPATTISWITISIVAGSIGTSILRSVQDRILAIITQRDFEHLKSQIYANANMLSKRTDELYQAQTEKITPEEAEKQGYAKKYNEIRQHIDELIWRTRP